jgi:hypothetical protein
MISLINNSGLMVWTGAELHDPVPELYWSQRAQTAIEILARREAEAAAAWRARFSDPTVHGVK